MTRFGNVGRKLKTQVLLDFGFFVDHMLTNNGIKFFDLHFFWHGALVLGRGVKVTSTRR